MGPSLTQTTQAQQSPDTSSGDGGSIGNTESSTAVTLQAQQPADTPTGNGDNTATTAPPPSGTATPVITSQTSQSPVSESAIQSTPGTKTSGSDGNVLLTIGSTTLMAQQTILPASGSASLSEPALVLGSSTLVAGGSPVVIQDQTISLVLSSQGQSQSQSSLPASQNTPAAFGIVVDGTTTLNVVAVSGVQVSGAEVVSTSGRLSGTSIAFSGSSRASTRTQETSDSASSTAKGSSVGAAPSSSTADAAATTSQSASEGNTMAAKHLCWVVFFVAVLGVQL